MQEVCNQTRQPSCQHVPMVLAEAVSTLAFVPASVMGQRIVSTCGSLPYLIISGFHAYQGDATSDVSQLSIGTACATFKFKA